jgi:microcystin-dependent protein
LSIPIPPSNFDDEPIVCLHINELWIPVLLGALQAYLNPPEWGMNKNTGVFMVNAEPIWEGDAEQQFLAEQQILGIMTALMLGNCEDDMPTGSVSMYVGTVAPEGWLLCDGSPYLKAVYPALWGVLSLHGIAYEDDSDNFKTPDLRGHVIVGAGAGPITTARTIGEYGGAETHTLLLEEIPSHQHAIPANLSSSAFGSSSIATATGASDDNFDSGSTPDPNPTTPHNNMPPFHVLNFIIKI